MMTGAPRIGVVLSSGGARGVYAHTGFLLALEDLGIPVSACAGCSAGAVVGGIAASGADLTAWSETLAHLDPARFWRPDPWPRLAWQLAVRRGRGFVGLSGTEAAVEFCRSQLAVTRFEACRYPFYTLALSLGSGRKVMFSSGELAPRMVASAAIPLHFRPVEIDGDWHCDGALVDLAPTDAICCKHQLDALIIHHVAARFGGPRELTRLRDRPWAILDVLGRLLFGRRPWYLSDEPISFHRCPCRCGAAVIVIEPKLPELSWPMTEGGPAVQAAAHAQARTLLQPYLAALLSDPRQQLLVSSASGRGAVAAQEGAGESSIPRPSSPEGDRHDH
jgi:predicted acylesterase/phospholipase RssA